MVTIAKDEYVMHGSSRRFYHSHTRGGPVALHPHADEWVAGRQLNSRSFDVGSAGWVKTPSFRAPPPLARSDREINDLFSNLRQQWLDATMFSSSVREIIIHPAYQRIIGLGPRVLPLIFDQLQRGRSGHWFWALAAITGEDPAAGITSMTEASQRWLNWANEHNYLR